MVKVGIPRGLLYYYYGEIWREFLQQLGAEVVVSGETTPETIRRGGLVDEVCLPVKAAVGHVYELKDKVDLIFLPRVISMAPGQYSCPNIIGLPDIVRNCIEDLPQLLVVDFNLRNSRLSLYRSVASVGRELGRGLFPSLKAWRQACTAVSKSGQADDLPVSSKPRVALLGHPYIIFDKLISMNVIDKLKSYGFEVLTADKVDAATSQQAARRLSKKIFWQYCHQLVGAGLAYIYSLQPLDGVIFVSSFACGPDSMVAETVKRHADNHDIPFLLLTLDEHAAQTGFVTRLEAFGDMLCRRRGL